MELSRDEKTLLFKFRQAKKCAQDNNQTEINILIRPGGKFFIMKATFQEIIKTEEVLNRGVEQSSKRGSATDFALGRSTG